MGNAGKGVVITSQQKKIRPVAVAGSWYPDDAKELKTRMDRLLREAKPSVTPEHPVRAVLLPHAGYRFSGATAAAGLQALRGKRFKRVLVLGPAHRKAFTGLSLPGTITHYRTPLGDIPLDRKAMLPLLKESLINAVAHAHDREHSVEMTLPLLQRTLAPGWKLLPVLVGKMDAGQFESVAKRLKPLLDAETLLVASGDFTHHGPNYRYRPFPLDKHLPDRLKKLDMGAFQKIADGDGAGLIDYQRETGITACAVGPAVLLTHMMGPDTRVQVVKYETSGALTGDFYNSVSYLAIQVTDPEPLATNAQQRSGHTPEAPKNLPQTEMMLLHRMARHALNLAITEGPQAVSAEEIAKKFNIPDHFRQPSGAFVTLKKGAHLRGCIGYIQPIKPLYRSVVENTVNAALNDHRFNPVEARELPELNLEVSVLSPMRAIASHADYRVDQHGIVLSKFGRRAVFLPEVAGEQGWDKATTLSHLSRKAGLPVNAWKSGSRFEIFTSQKYSAPVNPETSQRKVP